ncbi:MAG: hypothetical protein WCX73_04365 [Candidatus Pacearchaeota archaeon]|jgi:hypothetical protein
MNYKDYEGFTKTYVIVYVTGTGVMEDNFIDHNVVFETNDKEEADKKAEELKVQNNSPANIASTWYSNRYHVNINTLSENGKKLLEEFESDFDERLEKGLKDGRYGKVKVGDMTFYMDNRFKF